MSIELQDYYFRQPEPVQSCLLTLKKIILEMDPQILHTRKYRIPFFCYKEKNLGFLWVYRKKIMVGFVTDKRALPQVSGVRPKDKVETLLLDPNEDIPVDLILLRFRKVIAVYDAMP